MITDKIKKFRIINTIEGYSYLILLFVAMPMKYMLGIDIAVKIAGMAHGVLFIMLCTLLVIAWQEAKWTWKNNIIFFVASLVPFGTFYTSPKIKSYE